MPRLKNALLGVDADLLARAGTVDRDVAVEMVAVPETGSGIGGIATTGVAALIRPTGSRSAPCTSRSLRRAYPASGTDASAVTGRRFAGAQ